MLAVTPVGATIIQFSNPSLKEIQEGYNSGEKYQRYPGVRRENSCPSSGYLFCDNVKVGTVLPRIVDVSDLYRAAKKKQEVRPVAGLGVRVYFPVIEEIARQNQVSYEWLVEHLVINAREDDKGDTIRSIAAVTAHVIEVTEEQLRALEENRDDITESVAPPEIELPPVVIPTPEPPVVIPNPSTFDEALVDYEQHFTDGHNADNFFDRHPEHAHHPLHMLEGDSGV